MSQLTGILVVDAPASALNNAGEDKEARTDNAVAVKFIRAPGGQRFPYVSAQAVRFWLRTQLSRQGGWTSSPVFRETKVAYTDAEPTKYAEDDLFGYMRAGSKSTDEKKAAKRAEIAAASTPVDAETGEVTRISPLRVGTMVSTVPVRPTGDFGTMARAEGDPVPYEHQFYRAHLKAPLSLDLTCAGTFFVSKRVGYKNLDPTRQKSAKEAGAIEVKVRGFDALRLPIATRQQRADGRVQTLRRQRVVKDARHLGRRLAVRAGVGHGEGRGDAFRREEEIAGLCAEPAVEIDGEGVAACYGFVLVGACSGRRLGSNKCRGTEQREKDTKQ